MARQNFFGIALLLVFVLVLFYPSSPVHGDSIIELTQTFTRGDGTPGTQRSPQLDLTIQIETTGLLQLQYSVWSAHCSSIRLHILVDGNEVMITEWLGWPGHTEYGPLDTGLLDMGSVASGTHSLTLSPEGRVSGCNTGWLMNWGGTARILVSKYEEPPPDFTINASPSLCPIMYAGESTVFTITAKSLFGFDSNIWLTCSISPVPEADGITASFVSNILTPQPGEDDETTLTVTTTPSLPAGTYHLTIEGESGELEHLTEISVIIEANPFTLVFVPLNWNGDISDFEAAAQDHFFYLTTLSGNPGFADRITRIIINQNLVTQETDPTFPTIVNHAVNLGVIGDVYIAMCNREIWHDKPGVSNMNNVVKIDEDGITIQPKGWVTAHELGHCLGLFDEYNYLRWESQRNGSSGSLLFNTYPDLDDPNPRDPYPTSLISPGFWDVRCPGRSFFGTDLHCTMGPAGGDYLQRVIVMGVPIDIPHFFVGLAKCFCSECVTAMNFNLPRLSGISSEGLAEVLITFFRNGTSPRIENITALPFSGKSNYYAGISPYSVRVYDEEDTPIYFSNLRFSFLSDVPSLQGDGTAPWTSLDEVTGTWFIPAYSNSRITIAILDNASGQTIFERQVDFVYETDPPTSSILVGEPKHISATAVVYVKSGTLFTLTSDDGPLGSGVKSLRYRIYSSATSPMGEYFSYSSAFSFAGYLNGEYTIEYFSIDNRGNIESTRTMNVTLIGPDIDQNGVLDMDDILISIQAFGSFPNHPRWNPLLDLNFDEKVTLDDIVTLLINFGRTYP